MFKNILMALALLMLLCGCNGESWLVDTETEAEIDNRILENEINKGTQPKPQESNTDLEIVTQKNHPVYYDSLKDAHEAWDSAGKGKILFGDSESEIYSENTIIVIEKNTADEDMIKGIGIFISNFDQPEEVTLEKGLSILASYMPFDVIKQYYEYSDSYIVAPDEGRENENTYYVVVYSLTEDGRNKYSQGEHSYRGRIVAQLEIDNNGQIEWLGIGPDIPNWMDSLKVNSYHKAEWKCDLSEYK